MSKSNVIRSALPGSAFRIVRKVLSIPAVNRAVAGALRVVARRGSTVFMLHRFADRDLGSSGVIAEDLFKTLDLLRRSGVQFLSLRALLHYLEEGREPEHPTAVFTVDDGYLDFERIAAPVFRELDCPVTVFLTTGVVDANSWHWWDRVEHALVNGVATRVSLALGGKVVTMQLDSTAKRAASASWLIEELKRVPNLERLRIQGEIHSLCDSELPPMVPARYQTITWSGVHALEKQGVEFGPHSMTHPIFNRIDLETAREEIRGSWETLKQRCRFPVPIFCFPNGTLESFSDRDVHLVHAAGLRGAVVYDGKQIAPERHNPRLAYRISRSSFASHPTATSLMVAGLRNSTRT